MKTIILALCGQFLMLIGINSTLAQSESEIANSPFTAADTLVGRSLEAPINRKTAEEKFWWSDAWYDDGKLDVPTNHDVIERDVSFENKLDNTEIPATIFRPKTDGKFPAILFQHGRRGLDNLTRRLARRMAARGFVVLAPNVYEARFIERWPMEHLTETEGDVNASLDHLMSLPDISTSKACLYSHTRGGYYTLKVAVTFERQNKDVACYVSFYPHWQNPDAPEPMQVYRYAKELDMLEIPVLVFIGEYEQYQRRRSIETAVLFMKQAKKDVTLIVYPGVGRGFDFRPVGVRTFADDLATKDSNLRSAAFFNHHLQSWKK